MGYALRWAAGYLWPAIRDERVRQRRPGVRGHNPSLDRILP
jgi:hypothetical protein